MEYLEIRGLHKRYGFRTIFSNADHSFVRGVNILTGSSGSGKTTLLRILSTAEKPSRGELIWHGVPLPAARQDLRQCLGYAPQIVNLPDQLTGIEFGLYIAALKRLDNTTAARQFSHIMDSVGMSDDINNRIVTYSGGMRRRLIFAQAMLGNPELIILDEPTAELDQETAKKVREVILERRSRACIITTTHDEQVFSGDIERRFVMEDGTLSCRA